jgi:UDP-N-acetylglucosamine pyrophosphorylase
VRGADVNLNDDSCEPGPVSFIRGSVLGNYPQGDAFGQGSGQCQVIQAPKCKVKNYVKKASKIVHEFPTNIQYNLEETKIMKEKTNEYKEVLKGIKKMEPSNTLEQQYTDITIFDEQNKKALIVWSVISISILGFVFFRMKS